jgi:hypothetical protein
MPNFFDANSAVFSMHDLDPSRTPMWSFGHTNLRDRWIPVALPLPRSPALAEISRRRAKDPELAGIAQASGLCNGRSQLQWSFRRPILRAQNPFPGTSPAHFARAAVLGAVEPHAHRRCADRRRQPFAGDMGLPHGRRQPRLPGAGEVAETAVAEAVGMRGAVLLPEQLQCHALPDAACSLFKGSESQANSTITQRRRSHLSTHSKD